MKLIDTHCHLTFKPLRKQLDDVLQRAKDAGIIHSITVGTDLNDSKNAVTLANEQKEVSATVAVHPHEAKNVTEETMQQLKALSADKKVLAIGETGLDFHYNFSTQQEQEQAFRWHLDLAAETNLPVIIHSREAFEKTIQILDDYKDKLNKVVFHCFGGDADQAKQVIDRGYLISFTGVVTFKNAHTSRQAATVVPAERLMIETDAPYMSPEPMRKQKPNEPALMIHTVRFLANLKQIDTENFANILTKTTSEFFSLPYYE